MTPNDAPAAPAPELKTSFGNSLSKGQEVSLSDRDPGLRKVLIGVGWDAPEKLDGQPVDLDASAFLLNRENRVRRDTDFVFYNNLETENGALKHLGDNTTGQGDGDDEMIHIDLDALAFDIDKIAFSVTIHNAQERQQSFDIVKNAFIRVVNEESGVEVARFDLTEDATGYNAITFGELVRDIVGWKFKAIGDGHNGGLYKIARDYGVNVAPN